MAQLQLFTNPYGTTALFPFQQLRGGVFGVHFVDDALEHTLGREHKGLAQGTYTGLAAELLLTPGPESLKKGGLGVREKGERKFMLRAEIAVRLLRILAD